MRKAITKAGNPSNRARLIAGCAFAILIIHSPLMGAQAPVDLGTSGNYVILAKSGISTVPPSAVTGDLGVSPIDSTAITGFSLILDGTDQFSTSSQVIGKIYAADYASPTPANLTTAVSDMQTAYTDAAGRTLPDHTELGSGNIGGMTLAPGLYKWGTDVTIPTDVTLSGGANDVWIFQIAGNLTIAGATSVNLSGGAEAGNIFWQVAGGVGVDLGTTSHFEGIILSQAGINLQTGASINGRLLAQTAVTLDANTVTVPAAATAPTLVSAAAVTGPYADAIGQSLDLGTETITVPLSGNTQFYRIRSVSAVTITGISISGGNVVVTYR
jgi:Ice-binding-like